MYHVPPGPGLGSWFVVLQLLIVPLLFAVLIPAVPLYLSYGPTGTKNIWIVLRYKEQFTPFVQHQAAQKIAWQDLINKELTRLEAPGLRPQSACLEEVKAREHTTNVKHRHRYDFHHSPFPSLRPRDTLRLIPALQRLLKRPHSTRTARPGCSPGRAAPALAAAQGSARGTSAPAPQPQGRPLCPAPPRGLSPPRHSAHPCSHRRPPALPNLLLVQGMNVKGCTEALSQPALQVPNQPSDMELQDANTCPSWISSACVLHLRTHRDASSPCSALRYCCRAFAHLHSSPVQCVTPAGFPCSLPKQPRVPARDPGRVCPGPLAWPGGFSLLRHHTTSCSGQTCGHSTGSRCSQRCTNILAGPRKQQSKCHYPLFASKELTQVTQTHADTS